MTMTSKELLQLQDTPEGRKVLGEYLAELTVPKPWKCIRKMAFVEGIGYGSACKKCDIFNESAAYFKDRECAHPDPITIDDSDACMGMAVRMFRENCLDISNKEMDSLIKDIDGQVILNLHWLIGKATAFELLKIIALAIKEKPNGTE
jgi:hypothetical protein